MSDSDRVKTNTWGIGGEFIWFNQYRNQGYTYSVAPEDMFDLRWTATPPAWPQYPKMTDLLTIVNQKLKYFYFLDKNQNHELRLTA